MMTVEELKNIKDYIDEGDLHGGQYHNPRLNNYCRALLKHVDELNEKRVTAANNTKASFGEGTSATIMR